MNISQFAGFAARIAVAYANIALLKQSQKTNKKKRAIILSLE